MHPSSVSRWPAKGFFASDSAQAAQKLHQKAQKWQKKGFLLAGVDSLHVQGDSMWAHTYLGPQWEHWRIVPDDSLTAVWIKLSQSLRLKKQEQLTLWRRQQLNQLLDLGYPAAKLSLKTDTSLSDTIVFFASIQPGPQVFIDSVNLSPKEALRPNPLYRITGLRPGNPYRSNDLLKAQAKLKQTGFVQLKGPPELRWQKQKLRIGFSAEKNRPSSFTGILGLMPANDQTGDLLFTGELDLRLRNLLGYAERLQIHWQRLQVATQQLEIQMATPFLFGTGFGVEGDLSFFRIDTAFYQLNLRGGFSYHLGGDDFLSAFVQYDEARQLSNSQVTQLNNSPDATALGFGLQLRLNHLNDPVTPRRGYQVLSRWSTGTRSLPSDSLAQLVGSRQQTLQTEASLDLHYFWPIGKRMTLLTRTQGFWLYNPQLLLNQSHRLGGLHSLRGFDERSLFVSWYGIGTVEYRFILEQGSWLLLFVDGGPQGREALQATSAQWLLGTGAGMVFQTAAGQFAVHYALGFGGQQAEGFNRSKLHFGYLARF